MEPRLSRWETVGAWLRVWTPPRGAEVPPVPWKTLLAVLVVVAAGTVVIAGEVDEGKEAAAVRAERGRAERAAVRRRVQAREQRAVPGRLDGRRVVASAPGRPLAVDAASATIAAAVLREARARAAAGELERPARSARCRLAQGVTGREARVTFDCLAVTGDIRQGGRVAGTVGYPFRAVVTAATGRYAFCATNPIPGERVVPDPDVVVRLPAACRAPGT